VRLEPLLELRDFARALDLDVELDILGQARRREVARSHQRLRADYLELGVRDVRFRVELVAVVDAAIDLPRSERIEDCQNAVEEGVGFLFGLDAPVEDLHSARAHGLENGLAGAIGHLGTHQDSDLLKWLPFLVEREQRTDLEVSRGDIERLGDAGPFLEVTQSRPAGDAVVDDEEVATFGFSGHGCDMGTEPILLFVPASSSLDKAYPSPARRYGMILLAIEVMGSPIRECGRSGGGEILWPLTSPCTQHPLGVCA